MKSSETCRTCIHSLPIGNASFICTEYSKDTQIVVIEECIPTENYCLCNGSMHEEE